MERYKVKDTNTAFLVQAFALNRVRVKLAATIKFES